MSLRKTRSQMVLNVDQRNGNLLPTKGSCAGEGTRSHTSLRLGVPGAVERE